MKNRPISAVASNTSQAVERVQDARALHQDTIVLKQGENEQPPGDFPREVERAVVQGHRR